jgi:hypothetical protein
MEATSQDRFQDISRALKKQQELVARVPDIFDHYRDDPKRCFLEHREGAELIRKTLGLTPKRLTSDIEANALILDMIERYPVSAVSEKVLNQPKNLHCRLSHFHCSFKCSPREAVRFFSEWDWVGADLDPARLDQDLTRDKYCFICIVCAMRLIQVRRFQNRHQKTTLDSPCLPVIRERIAQTGAAAQSALAYTVGCPICRENAIIQFGHNLWYYILCLPRREEDAKALCLSDYHAFTAFCLAIIDYAIRRCEHDWETIQTMARLSGYASSG